MEKVDTYNRKELLIAIQKVMPLISSKNNEYSKFIFTGDSLLTLNDVDYILYPLKTQFKCAVPSNEFYNILSFLKEDEVSIGIKEDKVLIKTKNTSAELFTIKMDEGISDLINSIKKEVARIKKFESLPSDFMEGINICLSSVSKDISSPLSCIYISGKEIISSDDFRISLFSMSKKLSDTFLLPAKSARELIKFEGIKSYFKGDNKVFFLSEEGIILSFRIMNESFPKVQKNFDITTNEIILPKGFSGTVKNASVLADGEIIYDKRIDIKIDKGKVYCTGRNDLGKIESRIDIDTKQSATFFINPFFLLQILEKTDKMKIGEGKVMFETDKFKHLIALYMEE